MSWLSASSIAYGLLNILFGVLGFANARSMPSLIAGGAAGLLVIVGATLATTHRSAGYAIVALVSLGILGRFFKPAFMEGKVYPAMILAIASVVMLVLLTYGHYADRKQTASQTTENNGGTTT